MMQKLIRRTVTVEEFIEGDDHPRPQFSGAAPDSVSTQRAPGQSVHTDQHTGDEDVDEDERCGPRREVKRPR